MAKKGMGAVLSFLKGKLPAKTLAKVSNAVPEADGLMAVAEPHRGEAGGKGMLGVVTGLAGKRLGGGALVSKLTPMGFAPEQLQGFLKNVLDFLKGKLPDDVLKQLTGWFSIWPGAGRGGRHGWELPAAEVARIKDAPSKCLVAMRR
jgi:hypothetical protein